MMTDFAIHWQKTWQSEPERGAAPVADPVTGAECRHPPSEVLTIGLKFDVASRRRGARRVDGNLCMACGRDTTGNLTLIDGLARCYEEHGVHRHAGQRLHDLVDAHRAEIMAADEPMPLWFNAVLDRLEGGVDGL